MNTVLIGYRGTGKSVVAALLSERLGQPAVGMDAEIVKRAGSPIPEIVETHGWPRFRDLESEVVRELSRRDQIIIDTGGGVIERPENVDTLHRNGILFWLTAPVDVIVARIESGTDRPSLTKGKSFTDEVEEVLARRRPLYAAAADHEIDTAGRTPGQVAEAILAILSDTSSS